MVIPTAAPAEGDPPPDPTAAGDAEGLTGGTGDPLALAGGATHCMRKPLSQPMGCWNTTAGAPVHVEPCHDVVVMVELVHVILHRAARGGEGGRV